MGTFLSKPVTDLFTEEDQVDSGLSVGVSAMQGWRSGVPSCGACVLPSLSFQILRRSWPQEWRMHIYPS